MVGVGRRVARPWQKRKKTAHRQAEGAERHSPLCATCLGNDVEFQDIKFDIGPAPQSGGFAINEACFFELSSAEIEDRPAVAEVCLQVSQGKPPSNCSFTARCVRNIE